MKIPWLLVFIAAIVCGAVFHIGWLLFLGIALTAFVLLSLLIVAIIAAVLALKAHSEVDDVFSRRRR